MNHSSKYLIDEYPMTMLPSLASRIGGDEAVVLQQIKYWIKTNESSGNERVYKDGRWWVFNTVQQWQEKQFIWLAVPTVKRILQSLEQMTLVETEQFEKNNRNNRKWYTINHDAVERLDQVPTGTCFIKLEDRINLISSMLTGSNRSDGEDQIDPVILSKEITKEINSETTLIPPTQEAEVEVLEPESREETSTISLATFSSNSEGQQKNRVDRQDRSSADSSVDGEFVDQIQIDTEQLKRIHTIAFDWKLRPWRISSTEFHPSLTNAVWKSNPEEFSLRDSLAPNRNYIRNFLKKLDRQLAGSATEAIEAYTQLQVFWQTVQDLEKPASQMTRTQAKLANNYERIKQKYEGANQ